MCLNEYWKTTSTTASFTFSENCIHFWEAAVELRKQNKPFKVSM